MDAGCFRDGGGFFGHGVLGFGVLKGFILGKLTMVSYSCGKTIDSKSLIAIVQVISVSRAQVAELVDALASGASDRKIVEVRVFSWAPFFSDFLFETTSHKTLIVSLKDFYIQ